MPNGFTGRKLLVKIGDGASPEVFTTIAGARDHTITRNENLVDTTTKDSDGYRELLDGRILQNLSVSFTGVFADDATLASLKTEFEAGTHANYQLDLVSIDAPIAGETLEGAFRVTSMEQAGTHDGEVNFSVTLESDGQIVSS